MNKFKEAITQSVKLLSGRPARISVKQNGDMMMVEYKDNVAFVPVADEWPHAEVDKIAEELFPERRDMLAQQLGWGGKDEVYGMAMKFGVPQIVAITLHDTESALMVELADKTTFSVMPSDSLCGLWRATGALTVAQLANEIAKAHKASGVASVEAKWEEELARLATQWAGAAERAGVELEEGSTSVVIDEAARKVLVLIDDEVVGDVVASEDDEFGAWLGNSRKFGKSMANIAKKLAPVAETKSEDTGMSRLEELKPAFEKKFHDKWVEMCRAFGLPEHEAITYQTEFKICDNGLGFKYAKVDCKINGCYFGELEIKGSQDNDAELIERLILMVGIGKRMTTYLRRGSADVWCNTVINRTAEALVEAVEEVVVEVDVLAEAKRCMAVVMEEAGVDYPIVIEYDEDDVMMTHKIGFRVYNVSRISADKLGDTNRMIKAAQDCLREIKFQEREAEAPVEPVAEFVVEVAPVALIEEPVSVESVPEPVKAMPDTLSRSSMAKLMAKLYTATSLIQHEGSDDRDYGYGGLLIKWDDSTRELMVYFNRDWMALAEVPEGQTPDEWIADGRRNWRPIRKFAEQVKSLEVEKLFEGDDEYTVIGEVEAIEETLTDEDSVGMANDLIEPLFDMEYATSLAPTHPLLTRYKELHGKMVAMMAEPEFEERVRAAKQRADKRAEEYNTAQRKQYLSDAAYRAEADAWIEKTNTPNSLFRGSDNFMDLRAQLQAGMSLEAVAVANNLI